MVLTQLDIGDLLRFKTLRPNFRSPNSFLVVPFPTSVPWIESTILPISPIIIMMGAFVALCLKGIGRLPNDILVYVRGTHSAFALFPLMSLLRRITRRTIVAVKIGDLREDHLNLDKIPGPLKSLCASMIQMTDRFIMSRADIIAVPSALSYANLVRRRGMKPRGRVVMLPPGVDLRKIMEVRPHESRLKGAFIVGFVGSLFDYQGVSIVIEAVNMLRKHHGLDNMEFHLVGDGPERQRIETLCNAYGLKYHITGYLPHEKALSHLSSMDVLVVPSPSFSWTDSVIPIKVVEAWALGIPVVTTHHRIYDLMGVRDGEHIVFCEPNPSSVANKTLSLIRSRESSRRIAVAARKKVESFSYDQIARRMVSVVDDLLT